MSSIELLYKQLKKDSLLIDLTHDQKDEFVKSIKTLDESGTEIVYILIRMYELEMTSKSDEFPYNSKLTASKELKFDLEQLPNQLKWIIYKFIKKHLGRMSEESDRYR